MAPQLIVCLRHGEKLVGTDGKEIKGHPGLTEQGIARAQMLGEALAPGSLLRDEVGPLWRILVPLYVNPDSSQRRPWLTMLPLAERLKITPDPVCDKKDVGGLVTAVQRGSGVTVVCWEHDCLIDFLHCLAGRVSIESASGPLPTAWDAHRYDVLWLLVRSADEPPAYRFVIKQQPPIPTPIPR
jgi:hypothetical protein